MSLPDEGVDRTHLDRLGARFGSAFVTEMIDLFVQQGDQLLESVRIAIREGDVAAITSTAHALKSSAANLGATTLSTQAADVERMGREGASMADLALPVDAMSAELIRVGAALRAIRPT